MQAFEYKEEANLIEEEAIKKLEIWLTTSDL